MDYVARAAPIDAASLVVFNAVVAEVDLQLRVEQLRVGVAEAVYALLHISDNQTVVAVCQTVSDKRQQIFPLHPRRVLKLVEQEIVQIHADALIDERRFTPIDDTLHDVVCAGEQYCVVLVGEILHAGVDVAKQTELVGEVKNLFVRGIHRVVIQYFGQAVANGDVVYFCALFVDERLIGDFFSTFLSKSFIRNGLSELFRASRNLVK